MRYHKRVRDFAKRGKVLYPLLFAECLERNVFCPNMKLNDKINFHIMKIYAQDAETNIAKKGVKYNCTAKLYK